MVESGLSQALISGFAEVLVPANLLFCAAGAILGLVIGIIPGIGSAAAIAILLPATFHLDILPAIIMLSGIWYGSMYGGGVSAILLGVPGQSTAIMTVVDGMPMSRRGETRTALDTLVIASFCGGLVGFLGLVLFAPYLADIALSFGPPEYFVIASCGVFLVSYLVTSSVVNALISASIGFMLGCIGLDPVTAGDRFTFGNIYLQNGIGLIPMIMGLFGVSEVLRMIDNRNSDLFSAAQTRRETRAAGLGKIFRRLVRPIYQGSFVGFVVGLLPGAGAAISSYVAYALVKRWSPNRSQFGTGIVEGIAGPESGNNAATGSGMIPLLTLGLPADIVPAMMLGAFAIHGITPGPRMIVDTPELFWGIVMSFFAGNIILLAIMLPFSGLVAKIALIPQQFIAAILIAFMLGGAYGLGLDYSNIILMLAFGLLGHIMRKLDYPVPPLILAFILGPTIELSFRQTMIIASGNLSVFFTRPITASVLAMVAIATLVWLAQRQLGQKREIRK